VRPARWWRRSRRLGPPAARARREPVALLHRPADLRRGAVGADLPRRLIALRFLPISEYRRCAALRGGHRQLPGASPKVIAETVATPLEEQINGVEGMLYMSSQATTDGRMTLTVTFKLGTDPDLAQQKVQNRVSQAEPRLPEEVAPPRRHHGEGAVDFTMVVHSCRRASATT